MPKIIAGKNVNHSQEGLLSDLHTCGNVCRAHRLADAAAIQVFVP